jgi:hypothetical protein
VVVFGGLVACVCVLVVFVICSRAWLCLFYVCADTEYIETALLAQRLGHNTVILIEKIHEADLVLQAAKKLNIKPILGVRTKLTLKTNAYQNTAVCHVASSNLCVAIDSLFSRVLSLVLWCGVVVCCGVLSVWCGQSRRPIVTGDHSKFGLSPAEIMQVVEALRKENMMDCLQLLHFHVGTHQPQTLPSPPLPSTPMFVCCCAALHRLITCDVVLCCGGVGWV